MIALIIATKNEVSPEYSKSTLIGLSIVVAFQLVAEMRFSCPTFCAFQLGKADSRSLYARHSELRRLLRCNSWYVRKGTAEV
jgi:hypothetical protein